MTTSRGKKRPREVSITQKFMEENFPREIGESRKYFVRTEPESSLTKKTGNEHIIYYQPFLNYDLVITRVPSGLQKFGNLFEIKIKPAAWAAAFNQRDLESTTKFVLKAIVHTECRRIIIADRIARHNTLKIIERAIIFMMSKFNPTSYINPWSFPSSFDKIMAKFPSLDDNLASNIRSVLKRFDPRVEQDAPSQTGELFDRMDSIVDNFWDDRDLPDELGDFLEHVAREETNYEEMFRKCVTVVRNSGNVRDMKMDTAQIAAALTKGTITQNTDQIVDAVQFSEERWKAAFKSGSISIAKIAAKLSSTIIRLQFGDTVELMESFIGVESLCAVQMLAIYRASKFLHNIMDMKQGYEEMYDSQIPSHNVYPTVEECIEIDKEIFLHGRNNVLGRLRDLLQEQVGISSAEKGIPSTSASVILPQAPTTPLVLPIVQNVENIDLGNLPSPLEVLGIMNLGVENITQNPGIIGVSRTDHDGANFSWVELPLNKEELKALKLNGGVNGIEPKLLRDEYQDPTYISLTIRFPIKLTNGIMQEAKRSHALSKGTWTSTETLYKSNGPIHMGRNLLLKNIFDEDEFRDSTPSGRSMKGKKNTERKQLDEEKQCLIIDVIRYLTSRGIDFVSKPDYYHGPWSPSVEKDMRNEVICYGSNKIRGHMKKLGK